jgi:hypothetical protein
MEQQSTYETKNKSKYCCDAFKTIVFKWLSLEDGTKILPYIENINVDKLHVNYCPSCGAYIRGIIIKEKNE